MLAPIFATGSEIQIKGHEIELDGENIFVSKFGNLFSVEIANRGADEFLRVYYATYDSAQRAEGVPKFYRETSCLTYNGTAVTGPEAIKELLERLPITKHEVQSYDCHPISTSSPPALLITVSGLVTHGSGAIAASGEAKPGGSSSRNVDTQPRVFSQTFVLMKKDKYYVASDHFRFVG